MISFEKFKVLFNSLSEGTEIEIFFNDKDYSYMLFKRADGTLNFGKTDFNKNETIRIDKFNNIDELYNSKTVDNICFKNDWSKINDILIDLQFSVINDKNEVEEIYKVKL